MVGSSVSFDIQEEIIKRIPDVKAVIRFRSVSKAWKSVIDSPLFVKDHTQHRHLLVTCTNDKNYDAIHNYDGRYYYGRFQIASGSEGKYLSILDDDDDSLWQHHEVTFNDSLVCVYPVMTWWQAAASAVIWNPSTRKSINVDVISPRNNDNGFHNIPGHVIGFGVCPRTLDPKLVKIIWFDDVPSTPWQVEVYTLSSPGVWRSIINHNLPSRKSSRLRFNLKHVVVDHGFIYWLSTYFDHEFKRARNMIISFDVTTEEFTQVYLPDCLAYHGEYDLDISTRMDSLVLIQYITNRESYMKRTSVVWKMEEHSGVFTKLFNICIPADEGALRRVRGFRHNGEPIIDVRRRLKQGLYAYKPSSGSIKFTGIDISKVGYIECVASYMETLLLLDQ